MMVLGCPGALHMTSTLPDAAGSGQTVMLATCPDGGSMANWAGVIRESNVTGVPAVVTVTRPKQIACIRLSLEIDDKPSRDGRASVDLLHEDAGRSANYAKL